LILDEPETSLHPKWQIAYAKIICALAAQGCKVLVTTHSPYMLEALKGYSKPIEVSKFYLAQRDATSAIRYYDTAGDISPIIRALSQPLEDLIDDISHDF
jgi:predicted ATPase